MKVLIRIFIILLLNFVSILHAKEFLYILNEPEIVEIYNLASSYFKDTELAIVKEPRGIKLRLSFDYELVECNKITINVLEEIFNIKEFLAKIKNPVIIEVHTNDNSKNRNCYFSNWEVSTLIADRLEALIIDTGKGLTRERIKSVGYGNFLPPKNTSNNGGNYTNRIDIIILCNISGE